MPAPIIRLHIAGVVYILLGCVSIALFNPSQTSEHLVLGLIFGTLFGQTTLAAAWTCFGPVALLWRLPVSIVWVALLLASLAINVGLHGGPSDVVGIMILCLFGQWLLIQIPLWALVGAYGIRFGYHIDTSSPTLARPQFGIRELMIFTTIVAVVLGIGRVMVTQVALHFQMRGEGPIFIFLAAAAIVMTLPLLLAAMLPRIAPVATVAILCLIALATLWELPLMSSVVSGPGPDNWHLIWINGFTSAWIVAGIALVRACGYQMTTARRPLLPAA